MEILTINIERYLENCMLHEDLLLFGSFSKNVAFPVHLC